jgi:hypothetical protein
MADHRRPTAGINQRGYRPTMNHPSFWIAHKTRIIWHSHFSFSITNIGERHAQSDSMRNCLNKLPGYFCFVDLHHRSLLSALIYGAINKICKPLFNAAVLPKEDAMNTSNKIPEWASKPQRSQAAINTLAFYLPADGPYATLRCIGLAAPRPNCNTAKVTLFNQQRAWPVILRLLPSR